MTLAQSIIANERNLSGGHTGKPCAIVGTAAHKVRIGIPGLGHIGFSLGSLMS